jgi:hypothetical protein
MDSEAIIIDIGNIFSIWGLFVKELFAQVLLQGIEIIEGIIQIGGELRAIGFIQTFP